MPKPHSKPITLNSWGWVPGIGIFLSFWFHNAAKVGNHWTKGMLGILSWDTGSICWLQMIHYNKIQGWRSLQIIVLIVHGSWEMPLCVTHLSAPIMQAQRMGKREREIYSYDQAALFDSMGTTDMRQAKYSCYWQIPFLCDHLSWDAFGCSVERGISRELNGKCCPPFISTQEMEAWEDDMVYSEITK